MRLCSFSIQNFKSIVSTGVVRLSDQDNILVLAGQNESGKSAVLEALNYFKNGVDKSFNRLYRRKDHSPKVVCEFQLDREEIAELVELSSNSLLDVYLRENDRIKLIRGKEDSDDFKRIRLEFEQAKIFKEILEKNKVAREALAGIVEETNQDQENQSTQSIPSPQIVDIKTLEQYFVSQLGNFTLYGSFNDLLPGEIKISEISKYPAIKDFEQVFKANFAELVSQGSKAINREKMRLNNEASDNLNEYWTQHLEEGSKYRIIIDINPQHQAIETDTILGFMIDRYDDDPLYMEQKSQGFRWFSAFNLRLRALGVDKENLAKLVILVDEPGQGLHEKAQKNVKTVLEELAEKGAQIIYSTHHPNLIGTHGKEFTRIRVVTNGKEYGTKVETVSQFASRSNNGSKDALSPLVTAMGMQSIAPFIDANRYNVVVEGITDHYYLSAFGKILSKDENINFIPACGVTNVPTLVSVLLGWGVNYIAVFDDDKGSGRKAYNSLKKEFYENSDEEAHKRILKIKDCNGIEDVFSKGDFEKYVLKKSVTKEAAEMSNSVAAGDKKELLARMFLEKAEDKKIELSAKTTKKVEEVFSWIYDRLDIEKE